MFWSSVVLKIYFKTKQKGIRICKWNKTDLYSGLPSVCASYKEPACQCRRCRRPAFDPGSGRSPQGGHGNPLQYSCLENPMERGSWQATLHRVAKSWTRLNWLSMHAHTTNDKTSVPRVSDCYVFAYLFHIHQMEYNKPPVTVTKKWRSRNHLTI